MSPRPVLIAATAATLLLSACGIAPAGTVSTGGAAPAPSTISGSSLVNVPFGSGYDGPTLAVALSKPAAYSPSRSAFVQNSTGRAVAFNISITDKDASQPMPAMAINVQATSGDTQDQEIQDSANNVGTSTSTILPGHSLTWEIAFSVPKAATEITVQVRSLGGGKTIVFSGPLS